MEEVILGIGSNKGNREKNVRNALKLLEKAIFIEKISSFIITEPEEGAKGGWFLNGVVAGKTDFDVMKLFNFLQDIEKKMGRRFPHKRGDEREIDLDIIFYGNKVLKNQYLEIPHPRYKRRFFVLVPLVEILPDFVDPVEKKSIKEIYTGFLKKGKNGDIQE